MNVLKGVCVIVYVTALSASSEQPGVEDLYLFVKHRLKNVI